MVKEFKVDGMSFPTERQAIIVAKRLFSRYDRSRTVQIMAVDSNGREFVWDTYPAEREPEAGDTDTIEMF